MFFGFFKAHHKDLKKIFIYESERAKARERAVGERQKERERESLTDAERRATHGA